MPLVFRVMKQDPDGFPLIGPTSLGVRRGTDVDIDTNGNVVRNDKGMSVAPNWRDINVLRIPKRLRPIALGAAGSNNTWCFRMGEGAFARGQVAYGLILAPDSPRHGNIVPEAEAPIDVFQANLASTRTDWVVDET